MSQTVGGLAVLVKGTVHGNSEQIIDSAASIEAAGAATLTFVAEDRHLTRLRETRAAAVLMTAEQLEYIKGWDLKFTRIVVDDPQAAFQKILPQFRQMRGRPKRGISPAAYISPTAKIGEQCYIGAGAYIGDDVQIGDNCDIHPGCHVGDGSRMGRDVVLYPKVVIYHDCQLGDRVTIHAGSVIGADGFGYRFENGRFEKVAQLGHVEIHSDVEIGANATVDRGAVDATVVGAGTKIDNMVMVAHNCQIGRHNVFASQVGIAGSSTTGDYVRLGGQAGIRDHVHLGTGSMVGAKGAVHCDIPAGETWIGYPASPEADQKRLVFSLRRVPQMRDEMKAMQKTIKQLTEEIARLKAAGDESMRAAG